MSVCVYYETIFRLINVNMYPVVSDISTILPVWNSSINSLVFADGLIWPANAPMLARYCMGVHIICDAGKVDLDLFFTCSLP